MGHYDWLRGPSWKRRGDTLMDSLRGWTLGAQRLQGTYVMNLLLITETLLIQAPVFIVPVLEHAARLGWDPLCWTLTNPDGEKKH